MKDEEIPKVDELVACPRCEELVVTVEMHLPGTTVYWRCVRCGHIFVQRLRPETKSDGTV
jgi:uncharacterized C2H2 Zn-finger protein